MADLGGQEIIVIIVVVALLFGWKRMPDMARSLGRSARIFKSEVDQMRPGASRDTPVPSSATDEAEARLAAAEAEVARLRADLDVPPQAR
ncbi:MAG: Sec-independent protein translocase subunit TatA [Dermatophilaceae bacterium]